jgi:hypothetical protein
MYPTHWSQPIILVQTSWVVHDYGELLDTESIEMKVAMIETINYQRACGDTPQHKQTHTQKEGPQWLESQT